MSLESLNPVDSPSLLGEGLHLDASALDRNLTSIRQVERSWRLPALPDEVRLDLATSGVESNNLSKFLIGLDRDAHGENPEDFEPVQPDVPQLEIVNRFSPFNEDEASSYTDAIATIGTLRGLPQTEVIDMNAVQRFKLKAIEEGRLDAPEGGVVDGSWSPELSSVQRDMQFDQLNQFYRGDRPGVVPFQKALDTLYEWTSPVGLMRAAVNLDLFWDFNAIDNEFQSWGDKWRKVGKSNGPLDFGKNLLDAMTGPIDDIVVPILNMALLASGVGSSWNFARLGATGVRGVEAAAAFRSATAIYRAPKALAWTGKVFPALSTVEEAGAAYKGLSEASWLAQKLRQGGSAAETAGDAMAAWRAWDPVVRTKRLVQTGARLGLVSQVEDRLLPGYQGGLSLGSIPAVSGTVDNALKSTPGFWAQNVGEVLLTPYTFFEPGTFTRGGKDLLGGTFKLLGTAGGRAAAGGLAGAGAGVVLGDDAGDLLEGAAVGAGAGAAAPVVGRGLRTVGRQLGTAAETPVVGSILKPLSVLTRRSGEALALSSWAKPAQDGRTTQVFFDALRLHLPDDEFGAFEQEVRSDGFLAAFGRRYGVESDERSVGALMAFVLTSASIDRTASLQAGLRDADGFKAKHWLFRNKLTAQVRHFDPETVTPEELAWATVSKDMGRRRGAADKQGKLVAQYKDLVENGSPEAFAELVSQHNQQAALTMRQLMSMENLPIDGLDDMSARNLGQVVAEDPEKRYAGLTEYIATALDSFGNWPKYSSITSDLGKMVGDGMLLDAALKAPVNLRGRAMSQLELLDEFSPPGISQDAAEMDDLYRLKDTLFVDAPSVEQWRQKGGYYAPFARELDPGRSKFTVALKATPAKHEFKEAADELKETLRTLAAWKRVSRLQGRRTAQLLTDAAASGKVSAAGAQAPLDLSSLGKLSQRQMSKFTTALGLAGKSNDAKALRQLNWFAAHNDISIDDAFTSTIDDIIQQMGSDSRWSERFGLDLYPSEAVRDVDGNVEAGRRLSGEKLLNDRWKSLLKKAKYTAAEIDMDDLVARTREVSGEAEAQRLQDFVDHIDSQGYKAVYGAEFLMPDDLLNRTGMFADINERHLNAVTLGNFFGRKQPEALKLAAERSQRLGVSAQLTKAMGTDVSRDSEIVTQALSDVYRYILDPAQAAGAQMIDDIQLQSWLERRISGVKSYSVPLSLQDLGLGRNRTRVVSKLVEAGWEDKQAAAIWQGLKAGRHAEWRDQGLAAVEAKLRHNNQLLTALRVLGGTSNSKALTRSAVGAAAGAGVAAATDEDVTTGALVGAGAGALTSGKALGQVTDRAANAIDMSKWARYGYLADNIADLRDRLRFTLSPWFDISRFTEAHFLNNLAAPKRAADGTRIAPPVYSTPRGLRRSWAKELRQKGLSAQEATNGAQRRFSEVMADFRQAARGNFDPDTLESTGKWFQQVGIMGFNPTAYMATSFHHLRETGMEPKAAFEAVKDMFTYGTTGRSAAEMSANFVFFPFSFQKKAVTHAAQWLADDMTRSVLIHDAMKAYEVLNERYDLSEELKDHVPVLEKLQQLNLFAFGLSPGVLGGINAPFVNAAVGNPLSNKPGERGIFLNLFMPQAVDASNAGSADVLQRLVRRSIPAIYDVQYLLEDAMEQKNVMFDPSHQTRAAQARDGYEEWNSVKAGISAALKEKGFTWGQLSSREELARLNDYYKAKRIDLEKKYPGWKESRQRSLERIFERNQAMTARLDNARLFPDEASQTDLQLLQFNGLVEAVKTAYSEKGITHAEDWEPSVMDELRSAAAAIAASNRSFILPYREFYERELGPITSLVGR